MTSRSKAQVCCRSPAAIVGSNPTGGMDVCLLWLLWIVMQRSLRRAYHSSRGVLPTVMRRCVWSRNLKNEEAMDRVGPQRHKRENYYYYYYYYWIVYISHLRQFYIIVVLYYVNVQSGPKLGIQRMLYYILYTHFWPTLYTVRDYSALITVELSFCVIKLWHLTKWV